MMASQPLRVSLVVAQGNAYIWDVEDLATLRKEHQICGVLSGTLPHLSQQNVFLGIPLVLMPEEAVYLVEKQIACLVDDSRVNATPSYSSLQSWVSEQDIVGHQQLRSHTKGAERSAFSHSMSEEASKKRREREERKTRANLDSGPAIQLGVTATLQSERPSQHSSPTYSIVVPASSRNFDWYSEGNIYSSIESAKQAGIWDFPSNPHEVARCGIFRDLREKGYFIGGGIKFGGEYLVYPGDPLRYHSHFVASVQETPFSRLRPMELVAHGRLGTATKKAHLLCAWDHQRKRASYLSIEWAGFG